MTLEEENKILKKEIKLLKQQIVQVVGYCKNGNYGTDLIIQILESKKIKEIEKKLLTK